MDTATVQPSTAYLGIQDTTSLTWSVPVQISRRRLYVNVEVPPVPTAEAQAQEQDLLWYRS